jgi:N-acetylglucosaminyldiphosphoundecaprenol N-acetyl-beta-D-mannosaminyltransferase
MEMAERSRWPAKTQVVGTSVSTTSYEEVLRLLEQRPADQGMTIAVCNVHSVMTARRDVRVAAALEHADIATPDGMPLVWMLRRMGHRSQGRVYGPDLMRAALAYGVVRGWKHYFLGATDGTLSGLKRAAEQFAPGVRIVGTYAPPFRPLTALEHDELLAAIRSSGADLVWVGLGMPKQELLMQRLRDGLPGTALLGVGAAFDFLAGTVEQAPRWMQRAGLEWLFRLWQEPRRLWRRYVFNNPAFIVLAGRELMRGARRGTTGPAPGNGPL